MGGAEIEPGLTVDEFLAYLGAQHPVLTLALQQRAEAFFTGAVGRCRIQQVDAQLPGQRQQVADLPVARQLEAAGVLDPLVAADLDGAQPQGRTLQAGIAQRAVQLCQCHQNRVSHAGVATGGVGNAGSGCACCGWICWRCSSARTLSLRSGASASLVGQQTRALPTGCTWALSGRTRPLCAGSARVTGSVLHWQSLRSTQGSSSASSARARSIRRSAGMSVPCSARSPPRYQHHWPSAQGWVVTVRRGFGLLPRQWANSCGSPGPLTSTICSGRRCIAG